MPRDGAATLTRPTARAASPVDSIGSVLAVLDAMQARAIVADAGLDIVYLNDLAVATMRSLEGELQQAFGVSVDDLLDGSIHRFHRDPAQVERTLANVAGLPRAVTFEFGPVTISTHINAVREHGEVIGYVVVWEDVSEQLRTERMVAERASDARALNAVMAALQTATSPESAAQLALDAVRHEFGWTYGSYWQIVDEWIARHVVESGDPGADVRRLSQTSTVDRGTGLCGRAWRDHDVCASADLASVEDDERASAVIGAGMRSGVAFPILIEGHVVGIMELLTTDVDVPSAQRLDLLRSVGAIVAQTMQRLLAAAAERAHAATITAVAGEIVESSDALAAAAEELQAVASQMGANAEQTSEQVGFARDASAEVGTHVETVSAGAEEMAASIKEIARSAAEASRVASDAVISARATDDTVGRLGESSAEIGEIVKVITRIAQQTNLLALNATIEAARAGEAGRGFAVVAGEVKELAKATAVATADISGKIEAIQRDTDRSVDSIRGIVATIDQIAEFQQSIASAVEQQAATTAEMARSVHDASKGATRITDNIAAVVDAAASTASGAADSLRAASELAEMATRMHALVSRIRG